MKEETSFISSADIETSLKNSSSHNSSSFDIDSKISQPEIDDPSSGLKDFLSSLPKEIDSSISASKEFGITSKQETDNSFRFNEGVFLHKWTNVVNYSARVLEFNDEIVVVEMLIDKEQNIYEEREYNAARFKKYEIAEGKLFKIRYWERDEAEMVTVLENKNNLVPEDDFPQIDFAKKYGNIPLNKSKK